MSSSALLNPSESPLHVSSYGLAHTFHEKQVQPWSTTRNPAILQHKYICVVIDMAYLEIYH